MRIHLDISGMAFCTLFVKVPLILDALSISWFTLISSRRFETFKDKRFSLFSIACCLLCHGDARGVDGARGCGSTLRSAMATDASRDDPAMAAGRAWGDRPSTAAKNIRPQIIRRFLAVVLGKPAGTILSARIKQVSAAGLCFIL